jgi:Alpha amylase, catalytic domain
MAPWPRHPAIYEINTWVWLHELSEKAQRPITLGTVPAKEWDAIASYGFDAVWLMGVWERSPAGIAVSMRNGELVAEFCRVLPDFSPEDNVGSAYCVRNYSVDARLGGSKGLALARKQLADRRIRLILDFVPNHVAQDHSWVTAHPEYFIQGNSDDLVQTPNDFFRAGDNILACGRDPYFPAWQDVVQVNAFNPELRKAAIETASSIADQCDGMRCDMAMLLMNPIFERTWGTRAGRMPQSEYWSDLIAAVTQRHPDILFIAEAYWDLEYDLQQQGFHYCYDKRLYDRLEHGSAESIRLHLCAELAYQQKLIRFIENHDEPRAATTFDSLKGRAAAITVSTLQGAVLFHEGQFEGRRVRLPVFLRRRPEEPIDRDLLEFYKKLLRIVRHDDFRGGQWQLCERTGWPENQSHLNLAAWCLTHEHARHLIVVNYSNMPSQGRIRLPPSALDDRIWRMTDPLTGTVYERRGTEVGDAGLYVDLNPWHVHVLRF